MIPLPPGKKLQNELLATTAFSAARGWPLPLGVGRVRAAGRTCALRRACDHFRCGRSKCASWLVMECRPCVSGSGKALAAYRVSLVARGPVARAALLIILDRRLD